MRPLQSIETWSPSICLNISCGEGPPETMLYYFHALFGLFDHSLIYAVRTIWSFMPFIFIKCLLCPSDCHRNWNPYGSCTLQYSFITVKKLVQPTQRHYLSKGNFILVKNQEKIWFWCDWIQELKWLHQEQVSLHYFALSCPLCWPHSQAISLPCNVQDNMFSILKQLLFSLPSATRVRIILPLYDNLLQCLTLKFFFFRVMFYSFRIVSPFSPFCQDYIIPYI